MEVVEDRRRRWREQYRWWRDRETLKQCETRLERQRKYDRWRRATRTTEQWHNILRQRRERYLTRRNETESSSSVGNNSRIPLRIPSLCMHSQAPLNVVSICLVDRWLLMLVSGQGEKLLERNECPGHNLRQHSMIVFMSISLSVCTVLCVSLSCLPVCMYVCVYVYMYVFMYVA